MDEIKKFQVRVDNGSRVLVFCAPEEEWLKQGEALLVLPGHEESCRLADLLRRIFNKPPRDYKFVVCQQDYDTLEGMIRWEWEH
jgi:hypothetical protein